MYKFTRDDVLNAGAGRALEILEHVAGIRGELLDGHHHPCPKCGGTDRFRLIDKGRGAVYCNQCFNRKNRDFLSAVIWMKGCTFPEALELTAEHLGLKPDAYGGQAGDLRSVAEYVYTDPDGNEVYKVERHEQTDTITDDGKHPKKMIQYHAEAGAWKVGLGNDPDGKKLSFIPFPYHLGQLLKEGVRAVFICEGEKCADALQAVFDGSSRRGEYVATTISGGSNNSKNWGRFNQYLGDLPVYILPDHDDPGYKAGREAYKALKEANSDREILLIRMDKDTFGDPAPKSYDVADWIE